MDHSAAEHTTGPETQEHGLFMKHKVFDTMWLETEQDCTTSSQ